MKKKVISLKLYYKAFLIQKNFRIFYQNKYRKKRIINNNIKFNKNEILYIDSKLSINNNNLKNTLDKIRNANDLAESNIITTNSCESLRNTNIENELVSKKNYEYTINIDLINNKAKFVLKKHLSYPFQCYYTGYIENLNKYPHGYCKLKDLYNNTYITKFILGKINGYTEIKNQNDLYLFEGEYKNNIPEGLGIEIFSNKEKYTGSFTKGLKNGIGTLNYPDGSVYTGMFCNNIIKGYGIFYLNSNYTDCQYSNLKAKNMIVYKGYWEGGKLNGYGEITNDNFCYLGYFKNNMKNGFGILYYKLENKILMGYFKKDVKNGIFKVIKFRDNLKEENYFCIIINDIFISFIEEKEAIDSLESYLNEKLQKKNIINLMKLNLSQYKLLFSKFDI